MARISKKKRYTRGWTRRLKMAPGFENVVFTLDVKRAVLTSPPQDSLIGTPLLPGELKVITDEPNIAIVATNLSDQDRYRGYSWTINYKVTGGVHRG